MPWHIEQRGQKHCVANTSTGEVIQCYQTEQAAITHAQALYANEPDRRERPGPGNKRRATRLVKRAQWTDEAMANMRKASK